MAVVARKAGLTDLSDICAYGKSKLAESNYAQDFNSVHFRRVVKSSLADRDCCVLVALRDGEHCGLLIGQRMPMLFTPLYCATDLVFVADSGGDLLLDRFLSWAKASRVVRIDMGNSQKDSRAMDRFMRSRGLERGGGMYYANVSEVKV